MDETILLPSPNWFLVNGMAVSPDGWVLYGGPVKSLCILEPLPPNRRIIAGENPNSYERNGYRAHVFGKVHGERVTCVDASPNWLEEKTFLTGSADGTVKLWTLVKVDNAIHIKSTQNHTMHSNDQEEVVAVAYSTKKYAITLGACGRIAKWDLMSNVIKTHETLLAKFKPTCIACSPHVLLQVAVGTKQGVVILVDMSDSGRILYRVRGHDDEILSVSWCPQYNVMMKTVLRQFEEKKSANSRMEKIRQEANNEVNEHLDNSAIIKTLPEDSFDETVVEEEDLFGVYKDHEVHEFGHKKYTPEVIVVKEHDAKGTPECDYLTECQKLKETILKKKEEPTIKGLVDALNKTHVSDVASGAGSEQKKQGNTSEKMNHNVKTQPYKHLLASIGKHGHLRVWSKNGKLLGASVLLNKPLHSKNTTQKVNQPSWATLLWYKPDVLLVTDSRGQLLRCNPLKTDCRNKILEWHLVDTIHKRGTFCIASNASRVQTGYMEMDDGQQETENKITNTDITEHNNRDENFRIRNTNGYAVPEDKWCVWTAAQDRTLVCYSITKRRKLSTHNTCGSIIYHIQTCPYDAKRTAMCVGDGAVRIWEADVSDDEEALTFGHVTTYWQNVQGKVLSVAWHPIKENILAFGTAESRVGILDIGGSNERPARVLNIGVTGGVYSLSWGDRSELYVCDGNDVTVYRFRKENETTTISVKLEGQKWRLTSASWFPSGLLCGSYNGSLALLSNSTYEIQAVTFLFKKLINSIEWHPQFTSSSNEESSYKDHIAVSSMDKSCNIVILKHVLDEEGKHRLETIKHLHGHKACVLQLAWSPHREEQLASTSQDCTVRVWDTVAGTCMAIYGGHAHNTISLAWSAFPQLSNILISGGSDYCVRIWNLEDYPPEAYKEHFLVSMLSRKERLKKANAKRDQDRLLAEGRNYTDKVTDDMIESELLYGEGRPADQMCVKLKAFKRFLLPVSSKQMGTCTALAVRKFAQKYIGNNEEGGEENPAAYYDSDFLKIFGTTNEFNEVLDMEMAHHLQAKDTEAWIMLSIFRGRIDSMIQFANENDLLCPFLVSLSPSVSFKYWKDVTQLYLAQINRYIAQKREQKLLQNRSYGGPVFRKAALLLSIHDVKGAVECLSEARLFRDAYILCRARHMDSIARETLWNWVKDTTTNGNLKLSVICYLALGELYKASTIIAGVTKDEEAWLSLAADLAKVAGQHTFAGHLKDMKEQIKHAPTKEQEKEEVLEKLPSRVELLLKSENVTNGSEDTEVEE